MDLYRRTMALRSVQWYPGHIAKTEKVLKEQLKLMDVVIEVRDVRIPMSTSHPQVQAGIVRYPNVGKSSLINRLLKRRICPAAQN
ncbi:Ribosome biogenesis GTPase A [Morus notabilis]|uniref:Ribosome biogenesis GTPase A n=1 Tax=Morus notabilis TaxID=981085 RepID=W9RSK1_9ROSA|nr:Ribosome biogenesis GTPase A [Morus notabilis]